jgi:hypothetical protein
MQMAVQETALLDGGSGSDQPYQVILSWKKRTVSLNEIGNERLFVPAGLDPENCPGPCRQLV